MKHDFSTASMNNFMSSLNNCRDQLKAMRLSSEQLLFPLRNGIIYSIINSIQVDAVNKLPDLLAAVFSSGEIMLNSTWENIEYYDNNCSSTLDDIIMDTDRLYVIFSNMCSSLAQADLLTSGTFSELKRSTERNLSDIILNDYITYDAQKSEYIINHDIIKAMLSNSSDPLSDEIKRICFALTNIDPSQLSSDEKIIIQDILDCLSNIDISANMTNIDKEKVKQYVALYEQLHVTEKNEINKFFDNSVQGGFSENDTFNIKYLAYTSDDPSHTVFFRYIGQCYVSDFNSTNSDGSMGSWYSFIDHSIHLNKNIDGGFEKNPRGAYNTVFHEIGHNIDDLMVDGYDYHKDSNGMSYVNTFTWDELQEGKFFYTIRSDVESNIRNFVNQYSDSRLLKIDEKGKDKIVSALMDRRNATWLNPRLKVAYEEIYASYTGKINALGGYFGVVTEMGVIDTKYGQLDGASNEMISDIYGGVTNNSVGGNSINSYGHDGGHPFKNESSYWYYTDGTPTEY